MTQDRPSIFTMLHHGDRDEATHPDQNVLVDVGETDDGLLWAVLRIRNSHYTGYVKLPEWFLDAFGGDRRPDAYTIEQEMKCYPYGGITYGPDRSGWVGGDFNHGPADTAFDADGEPLPNNIWFDREPGPFDPEEPNDWTPEKARERTIQFADCLGDRIWEVRDGRWGHLLE